MPRLNAAQSFYGANSSSREAEIDLTKQKYEHAGYGSPASSITALRLELARQQLALAWLLQLCPTGSADAVHATLHDFMVHSAARLQQRVAAVQALSLIHI